MKKKNRTWRAAALLLALTLVTSCFVGGTFAKYTTTGEATDTARVAKFGVTVEAGGSLFDKTYKDAPVTESDASLTVNSSSEDNVLAPGTKSSAEGLTINVTGTPEVDVKVTSEIKAKNVFLTAGTYAKMVKATPTSENFKNYYVLDATVFKKVAADALFDADGTYYELKEIGKIDADYYPVQYKLDGGTGGTSTTPSVIADSLVGDGGVAKTIATKLGITGNGNLGADGVTTFKSDTGKEVAANKELTAELGLNNQAVTWKWDFEQSTPADASKYDKEDTLLGDMMAHDVNNEYFVLVGGNADAPTYTKLEYDNENKLFKNDTTIVASLKTEFNLSITVTQVD